MSLPAWKIKRVWCAVTDQGPEYLDTTDIVEADLLTCPHCDRAHTRTPITPLEHGYGKSCPHCQRAAMIPGRPNHPLAAGEPHPYPEQAVAARRKPRPAPARTLTLDL